MKLRLKESGKKHSWLQRFLAIGIVSAFVLQAMPVYAEPLQGDDNAAQETGIELKFSETSDTSGKLWLDNIGDIALDEITYATSVDLSGKAIFNSKAGELITQGAYVIADETSENAEAVTFTVSAPYYDDGDILFLENFEGETQQFSGVYSNVNGNPSALVGQPFEMPVVTSPGYARTGQKAVTMGEAPMAAVNIRAPLDQAVKTALAGEDGLLTAWYYDDGAIGSGTFAFAIGAYPGDWNAGSANGSAGHSNVLGLTWQSTTVANWGYQNFSYRVGGTFNSSTNLFTSAGTWRQGPERTKGWHKLQLKLLADRTEFYVDGEKLAYDSTTVSRNTIGGLYMPFNWHNLPTPFNNKHFIDDITVMPADAEPVGTFTDEITVYIAPVSDPQQLIPEPYGAVPSPGELEYHKEEMSAFIHYGMNTYTNKEWGDGTEDPAQFTLEPGTLDAAQWVKTVQDAGFGRLVMIAKHHDGFCNWFTETTQHSVEYAPGAVDVLAEVSKACTAADLDMGLYLSPWDENAPAYGSVMEYPEGSGQYVTDMDPYNQLYIDQFSEILDPENKKYGNDGKFVEVWMDSARGSIAVGGDVAQTYFFDENFMAEAAKAEPKLARYADRVFTADETIFGTIRKFNPDMVIFSGAGAELRWPGNENGNLMVPNWSKINHQRQRDYFITSQFNGSTAYLQYTPYGDPQGDTWSIAEADTSILTSGWFETFNSSPVKSLATLGNAYFNSVGRGGVLLLNFAPGRNGKLSDAQVNRAKEFGDALKDTFATNMAAGGSVTASSVRADHPYFSPNNVIDDDYDTYWTMNNGYTTGELIVDLGGEKEFDIVSVQEYIPLGQRITSYKVDVLVGNTWVAYGNQGNQKSIGYKSLIRGGTVKATKVRITIDGALDVPMINSVGVYKAAVPAFETGSVAFIPDSEMQMLDERDPAFVYGAGWSNESVANNYEGTHKYSSLTAGREVTITFTGDSFYLIGIKDPNHGKADVYIDGELAGVADFNGSVRSFKQLAYASPPLANGEHTVRLVSTEAKALSLDAMFYTNITDKPFYYFSENDAEVGKYDGTVDFTVYRQGDISEASSVRIVTDPASAMQGLHYQQLDAILSFEPDETEKTVSVEIFDHENFDRIYFYLSLSAADGEDCYLNSYSSLRVSIVDSGEPAPELYEVAYKYGEDAAEVIIPGNTLTSEVTVRSDENLDYLMIVALYNSDGKLVNAALSEGQLASGQKQTTKVDLVIPEDIGSDAAVRTFFWDKTTFAPIFPVNEF